MAIKFEKAFDRIEQLLGKRFEDMSVSQETLVFYQGYLSDELGFPIEATGTEDFSWEEFYLLGPGDKQEYEQLKRSRPSYTDIFRITKLSSHIEKDYGLFAHVTRISDRKRFELLLADLKGVDQLSAAAQLLEDYAIWFVNY